MSDKKKEYDRKKYLKNKENIIERSKNYYQNNKIEILEKLKDYRDENKETYLIKERENHKKFYEKHKDYLSEKIKCECGLLTRRDNINKHKKTKIHLQLLKN